MLIELIFLKSFKSLSEMSKPQKYKMAYSKAEPWPALMINLSLPKNFGCSGSMFIWWANKVYIIGAIDFSKEMN